jgi:PGF-pre-PGF domain-containing protein
MLKGKSTLVLELPSGEVYKSFNIWVGNAGFATSNNIENSVICFKVEKSWIQDK